MSLNPAEYRRRNRWKLIRDRLRYPPPFYVKSGGLEAVVHHEGKDIDLGKIAVTYSKRWGVGSK